MLFDINDTATLMDKLPTIDAATLADMQTDYDQHHDCKTHGTAVTLIYGLGIIAAVRDNVITREEGRERMMKLVEDASAAVCNANGPAVGRLICALDDKMHHQLPPAALISLAKTMHAEGITPEDVAAGNFINLNDGGRLSDVLDAARDSVGKPQGNA